MVSAIPIPSIYQAGLLMSTFHIPRHSENAVGLLVELQIAAPPQK
jgi:hypothetical protein